MRRSNSLVFAVAAALCLAVPPAVAMTAPALPPAVAALAPGLAPQGGGVLRFLGIAVYDGWYWSEERGWSLERPFALDLHYHRSLVGSSIAERSVDEIAGLGLGSAAQRSRWGFHNGRPIGEIVDREFARAFFGIWLDPRTSRRDFRSKLLNGAP